MAADEVTELNHSGVESLHAGDAARALECFNSAESVALPLGGAILALTHSNQALAYKHLGDWETALEYLEKTLDLEQRIQAEAMAQVTTHLNLAAVLSKLERHQEALQHALDALELTSETVTRREGTDQPPSLADYTCLAIAYLNTGVERERLKLWQGASLAYRQGFEVASRCLGPRHPLTKTLAASCGTPLDAVAAAPVVRGSAAPVVPGYAVTQGTLGVDRSPIGGPTKAEYDLGPLEPWPPKNCTKEEKAWYAFAAKHPQAPKPADAPERTTTLYTGTYNAQKPRPPADTQRTQEPQYSAPAPSGYDTQYGGQYEQDYRYGEASGQYEQPYGYNEGYGSRPPQGYSPSRSYQHERGSPGPEETWEEPQTYAPQYTQPQHTQPYEHSLPPAERSPPFGPADDPAPAWEEEPAPAPRPAPDDADPMPLVFVQRGQTRTRPLQKGPGPATRAFRARHAPPEEKRTVAEKQAVGRIQKQWRAASERHEEKVAVVDKRDQAQIKIGAFMRMKAKRWWYLGRFQAKIARAWRGYWAKKVVAAKAADRARRDGQG